MPVRGRAEQSEERFLLSIESWSWDYSYWFSNPIQLRRGDGPIADHGSLSVRGAFIAPKRLAHCPGRLIFVPISGLTSTTEPKAEDFGELHQSRGSSGIEGFLVMPGEAMCWVCNGFAGGCYRFVSMTGTPWRYRSSGVRRVSFDNRAYSSDYPDVPGDTPGLE